MIMGLALKGIILRYTQLLYLLYRTIYVIMVIMHFDECFGDVAMRTHVIVTWKCLFILQNDCRI